MLAKLGFRVRIIHRNRQNDILSDLPICWRWDDFAGGQLQRVKRSDDSAKETRHCSTGLRLHLHGFATPEKTI